MFSTDRCTHAGAPGAGANHHRGGNTPSGAIWKRVVAVLTLTLLTVPATASFAGTSGQAPIEQRSPAPPLTTPATAPKAAPADVPAPTYAEREAAAQDLEQFQGGGNGIYIGSTAAIVLLVVILIILL